jgi:hypothetical protein
MLITDCTSIQRPALTAPVVILEPQSEAEELDDALDGLGVDSLDSEIAEHY